jgi:hypothetical protein
MIAPRDHLRPKNRQACYAKGSRQLVEQARPVPSDNIDHGQGPVQVVLPFDHRVQGTHGIRAGDRLQQPIHHLDVERDLGRVRLDEVAFRQQIEVRRDLVRADAGNLFGNEFLKGHLQAL